jgi:hypothetical protein
MEAVQSAQTVQGVAGGYGVTGTFGQANGVAMSYNGGASWNIMNVPQITTQARYGAFPTANNWFMSTGTWPSDNSSSLLFDSKKKPQIEISKFVKIPADSYRHAVMHNKARANANKPSPSTTGWWAEMFVTADAGKTWTSVFQNDTFYFNDIRCSDSMNCFVCGENDDYAFVYVTNDGGNTWTEKLALTDVSLLSASIALNSPSDWYVGGGMTQSFTGGVWHSNNMGKSWTLTSSPGVYFAGLAMIDANSGFAAAMTQYSRSEVLAYGA